MEERSYLYSNNIKRNSNKNLLNYFKRNNKIQEENKNNYIKINNILSNKRFATPRNNQMTARISRNINPFEANYLNDNRTIYQNHNELKNPCFAKDNKIRGNDSKTIYGNSRVNNLLKNNERKLNIFKGLNRTRSTAELLNKETIYIFPAIRPRKIIIDYCCGPYDFRVNNINKRNLSYKKLGKNTFFMGGRYNPDNYTAKEQNRFNRNYYGKLFSN